MSLTPRPPRENAPIDVLRVGPERGLGGRVAIHLSSSNFTLSTVSGGDRALRAVESSTTGPEVLLLDDGDPGLDPLDVATAVHGRDQDLPVVLCTTDPSRYGPRAVVDAGITEIVTDADLDDGPSIREAIRAAGRQYRDRQRERMDASLVQTMLDQLPVHLFAKDRDGRHVRSSSALYDPDHLLGKRDYEAWPDTRESLDEPEADDRRVVTTGDSIHNKEEYSPVEDGWFLISKVPWYDGEDIVGLAGLAIDVTDRKHREEELEATSKLLSTIVQTSPAAIVVHATDGTVQFWNPAAADLFGWSPKEAIRKPYPPYLSPDDRQEFERLVESVVESGSIGPVEVSRRTKDGQTLDLQLSAATLDDADGTPSRIVSVLTDVTDLKERERRLKRQNDRLEQFTRVLAHDLRNPVQVVQGQLDRTDDAVDEQLIERAVTRIEAIVDDVLSVARAEPLVTSTEQVSLASTARDVWEQLDPDDATLSVDAPCTFKGNRARLFRLLGHLFENSITHGGTGVTVSVGCLEDGFYVADDGSGLVDADSGRIFEPGYSTEPHATGFGLNVVREITEAHGWEIHLSDVPDGVRFEIRGVDDVQLSAPETAVEE